MAFVVIHRISNHLGGALLRAGGLHRGLTAAERANLRASRRPPLALITASLGGHPLR